ncbi:ABC transporter substrate-binding protein [Jiangella anatolica]|uniref:ABC transporter substrate-binding protein n=1 Tax=Jiangella anatolica TaxID=2670374 RepID=UPI0018F34E95|nr:ABC transporter substrate-binding protein [Jiangella anatolica]
MNRTSRTFATVAGIAGLALVLAACGDDADSSSSADGDPSGSAEPEEVTLSVATFGTFGYEEAGLFEEYEQLNPHVTIEAIPPLDGGPYHEDLFTKLAAGGGLADVVAFEEGHIGRVLQQADKFVDLGADGPDTDGRWLDWKTSRATTPDGRLIGYGTDIGPLAICYNKELFAAAGLPTEPEEVAGLFTTWEDYFSAGRDYVAATGKPWFDSSTQMFNAMVNQLPEGFTNEDNEIIVDSNPAIREVWDQVTTAIEEGQSAKLAAWSPEWNQGFANGGFATQACPSWMLGVIEGAAGPDNAGTWAVADVFPDGGGNWGGAWLGVPLESDAREEAVALAAWLTAPEQQIKAFNSAGTFPSQVDALNSPDLLESTNEYFGQEVGSLFAARAEANGEAQHKGPFDGAIQENASSPALQAVEGGTSAEDGWQQFLDETARIVE